jgi:hypothetical protein
MLARTGHVRHVLAIVMGLEPQMGDQLTSGGYPPLLRSHRYSSASSPLWLDGAFFKNFRLELRELVALTNHPA